MTTFRHGTEMRVYVHNLDMSQYAEEAALDLSRSLAECKPLAGGNVSRVPGWRDVTLTISALYDANADASIFDQLDDATEGCFAVMFDGDTAGNAAYLGVIQVASDQVEAGDAAIAMPVQAFGAADVDRGISLHPLTERSTSASTTSRDDNAGGTTSVGAQAYLIVTSISASDATLTCKVEHSTNDSDWSDLLTFTNVTSAGGVTSEKKATATDADVYRYIKVTWTITVGKTATFFVGWKRNS